MFEWSNETILNCIEMYHNKEILWNPLNKNNFNSLLKNDAWVSIANGLSACSMKTISSNECHKKINVE